MSRPLPTTAQGRQTRGRIVAVAMTLFREHGVAAVTLEDVEKSAGVGRSQIYHYFEGRDDLIRAVVDVTVDTVLSGGAGYLSGLDSLAGIERWFAALEAACLAGGGAGGCPIGSLVGQLVERDAVTRAVLVDAFARWETPLTVGLAQLRSEGVLRSDLAVEEFADFVMAAIQGGLLLAQVRRDPAQLRHALDGARTALAAVTGSLPDGHPG